MVRWVFVVIFAAGCAKQAQLGPGPDGKCLDNELTVPCRCVGGGPGKQCKAPENPPSPCVCLDLRDGSADDSDSP